MDHAQAQSRSPLAASGVVGGMLLVLWLAAMVGGLVALRPRLQAGPAGSVEEVERYLATLSLPAPSGRVSAYRLGGCRCPGPPDATAATLRGRFQRAGFTYHELSPPPPVLPYPLVVVGPDARLLYAGPARWDRACGGRDLLFPLLRMIAAGDRPALVVESNCTCS